MIWESPSAKHHAGTRSFADRQNIAISWLTFYFSCTPQSKYVLLVNNYSFKHWVLSTDGRILHKMLSPCMHGWLGKSLFTRLNRLFIMRNHNSQHCSNFCVCRWSPMEQPFKQNLFSISHGAICLEWSYCVVYGRNSMVQPFKRNLYYNYSNVVS